MFRKNIFLFFCLTMLGACGQKTETSSIATELSLPQSLAALTNFDVQMSLYDAQGSNLVAGPFPLQHAQRIWSGDVPKLDAGDYLVGIQLIAPAVASPAALFLLNQPLVLAQAYRLFSFPGGNASTRLSFRPIDFSTDLDADQDGRANLSEYIANLDPFSQDSDNDGIIDGQDAFPLDVNDSIDEDLDGVGNGRDNCPFIANPLQENFDQDRFGDLCDDDSDNDGFVDAEVRRLGSNSRQFDTDGDGLSDGQDNCPVISSRDTTDLDGDGQGNVCDADNDGDGVVEGNDNCPLVANATQADADHNGIGDACSNDDDGDGLQDDRDNCPLVANLEQDDLDRDTQGDACDLDDDNDGLSDEDERGLGADHTVTNPLSIDTDGDGITDSVDNCPSMANSEQPDADHDGDGDACDCDAGSEEINSRSAIFVSILRGRDQASGAINDPVRTIARAIQAATQTHSSSLYLSEGVYEETVSIPVGLNVYGGFVDSAECRRLLENHETIITNGDAITMQVHVGAGENKISGVTIRNQSLENRTTTLDVSGDGVSNGLFRLENSSVFGARGGDNVLRVSRALSVENARLLAMNNVISGGVSRTTLGIDLNHVSATQLIHNTIMGGQALQTSIALQFNQTEDQSILLANNIFVTEKSESEFSNDQKSIFYAGRDLPRGMVRNNLFKSVNPHEFPKLFLSWDHFAMTVVDVNALDGNPASGDWQNNFTTTQNLSQIFADTSHDDFHLILGSAAVDSGMNPQTLATIPILFDHDNQTRPIGTYDVGAYELH